MYIPAWSIEDRPEVLFELIRSNSFGLLVTQQPDAPVASHLPFLLQELPGGGCLLRSHMARANPQWRDFEAGGQALAVFSGPHAYISPRWYVNGPAVPTWNYASVHAWGRPRLLSEEESLAMLEALVAVYEPDPAALNMPDQFIRKMLAGIVAFEIVVERIEGKWKMSQNRPDADREGVVAALSQAATQQERDTAALVQRARDEPRLVE